MEKEKVSWINFSEDAKARYYYDISQRPDVKRPGDYTAFWKMPW